MRTTHLLDLITWKGCEKTRNVWHTLDNNRCPVAVAAPWTEARFTRCLSDRDERYRYGVYTLRVYYAICLWRKTFETLMSGDAKRYDIEWVNVADGFRSVRYLNKPVSELIAEFRSELKRTADAGTVSVRLGRYDYPSPAGDSKLIVNDYVLEPEMFTEDRGCHRPEKWSAVAPGEPKTFGWEEIKDYFVDLSEIEVAFLEGAKMRRCTELDGRFLKACEECDLVEVKRLLDAGANMYATDEWGDCAGGKLVESCWDEPAEGKKKAQEALELLLDRGYDLDFCGYDSTTPRLARNAPGLLESSIMLSLSLSFSSRLMHLTRIRTRRCLKSSVRRTDTRECEMRFGTSHELLNRYLHISLAALENELVPSEEEQVREQVGGQARMTGVC